MPCMNEDHYFEKIAEYKLLAKHEVGQNFLIDRSSAKAIVDLLDINEDDNVLEIGSGAGSLSFYLSSYSCPITLIDIDEALITKLKEDFSDEPNISVIQANALKFDMAPFTKIVGNLPYYITSSLLEKILLDGSNCQKASIMVQKEVFSRLSSKPKVEGYGPLPILIEYRTKIRKEFVVPRSSFSPAPHVDSLVFTLSFKEEASITTAKELYRLTNALFLHRRKTILNNLSSYLKDEAKAKEILVKTGIDAKKRPEEIDINGYLSILASCTAINR